MEESTVQENYKKIELEWPDLVGAESVPLENGDGHVVRGGGQSHRQGSSEDSQDDMSGGRGDDGPPPPSLPVYRT